MVELLVAIVVGMSVGIFGGCWGVFVGARLQVERDDELRAMRNELHLHRIHSQDCADRLDRIAGKVVR